MRLRILTVKVLLQLQLLVKMSSMEIPVDRPYDTLDAHAPQARLWCPHGLQNSRRRALLHGRKAVELRRPQVLNTCGPCFIGSKGVQFAAAAAPSPAVLILRP